jgi:hypothetical protein
VKPGFPAVDKPEARMLAYPYSGPILRAVLLGPALLSAQGVFGQDGVELAAPAKGHDTPAARRVTDALNLREVQGYAEFDNFREEGSLFAADTKLDGKLVRLFVDPDMRQIRISDR